MSVSIVDGPMVTRFVEDVNAFDACVKERFQTLDANGDGVLSASELRRGFEGLKLLVGPDATGDEGGGLYDVLFEKFDANRNGTVDIDEFKAEMREIMMALARGIGESPVTIAIENDSLLMKVVQHDSDGR